MIHVEIDSQSGFCFGVVRAIEIAEQELKTHGCLSSLGLMVHNDEEVKRLENMGMRTIDVSQLDSDVGVRVLIRAHGEPPSTYRKVETLGKTLIDATCPIVLQLQKKVEKYYIDNPGAQIVIYGKPGHAEVIGLVGQTSGNAFVVTHEEDIEQLDPEKPLFVFSQTTMPLDGYAAIQNALREYMVASVQVFDTICRKVSNRVPLIRDFARQHDACVFVAGKKSSNGQMLYNVAREANPRTYFVSNVSEINPDWFSDGMRVGVCGATSTPMWQMEAVADFINGLFPL